MKILKTYIRGTEIFDTDNLELIEPYNGKPRLDLKPLRYVTHPVTDYEFLETHFGNEHPILNGFDSSSYFSFNIIETTDIENSASVFPVNILGELISIHKLLTAPKIQLDFISDYIERINSFRFNVETYRSESDNLKIQNMDLWIESYIEIVPDLQLFRNLVRGEMTKLGINCRSA